MNEINADSAARTRALDARRSFIVQAPAGSGKTSLLVQRFLLLLSLVNEPEEVLAITFTRKAAAEMRHRVIEALQSAALHRVPDVEHERVTWDLAARALQQDQERGWNLLEHPNRLRIQTIDGLCGGLTRQMPVLARAGAVMQATDHAAELYRTAAKNLMHALADDDAAADALETLLAHLDNDWNKARDLIAAMLAKRDQWLRHLVNLNQRPDPRGYVERTLRRIVEETIAAFVASIPARHREELLVLLRYAADNAVRANAGAPLAAWRDMPTWPAAKAEDYAAWRALPAFLMTGDALRKQASDALGFPAPANVPAGLAGIAKDMKQRYKQLLQTLSDLPGLVDALRELAAMPPPSYGDDDWHVVSALADLLRFAGAHLRLVFRQHGQVDFTEIAHAAGVALGDADAPTDLALALDYRISHILVDEFQDTSFGQFALFRALTTGWQDGDGRTVFLVGDPMQSIYRFREAQVGLFLSARQQGFGTIALESVNLTVNFRSTQPLVDWFNRAFSEVLPKTEQIADGAVSYTVAVASAGADVHGGVRVHALPSNDAVVEAARVVDLIREVRAHRPQSSIAVLVQTRKALAAIAPALRDAGIAAQAVEIESLATRPVIQDLLALTRALLHPEDATAWYALLHAPWCGLSSASLLKLAESEGVNVLEKAARFLHGATDGGSEARRLDGTIKVLRAAILDRNRTSWRRWVETTWWRLGGPACLADDNAYADAQSYFDLLERLSSQHRVVDAVVLNDRVEELYASSAAEPNAVQLMTIHKSKGLQFDVVIVPGLGRVPSRDHKSLLLWQERPSDSGESEMIFAPLAAAATGASDLYRYVERVEKRKSAYERGRLLYVAATRAKRELHLMGYAPRKDAETEPRPRYKDSFLSMLWPVVASEFAAVNDQPTGEVVVQPTAIVSKAEQRVLRPDQILPDPPSSVVVHASALRAASVVRSADRIEYLWATPTAMAIGTIVHQLLRQITLSGYSNWDRVRIESLRSRVGTALRALNVTSADEGWATRRVLEAICNTLGDPRGQWIVRNDHVASECEWSVSGVADGRVHNIIIDRSFIDESGTRWIIDYKTGFHAGPDKEGFLDNELLRYGPQLGRYVAMLSRGEARSIRAALYFPLLTGWRELTISADGAAR